MNDSQAEDKDGAPLRVAFETMGCRSNYADTVDLQASVIERGGVPCEADAAPDVIVINTCTVTDSADKEALKLIRRAKAHSPLARIVVTGCMAEVNGGKLNAMPEVSSVVGPGRREEAVRAIFSLPSLRAASDPEEAVPSGRRTKKSLPARRSISLAAPMSGSVAGPGAAMGELATRARFHLRIQEGCENSCTFCIIPQTRGRLSSRSIEALLADVAQLSAAGYEEIVLTGTHIGGYGEDFGGRLHDLLLAIAERGSGPRIRLSSIDPNDLSLDTVDLLAESHIFCKHLHICVQSFSDSTLKRMNRRYALEDVRELMCYIEQKIPGLCIGSDLIAGFPGECRQEVDQGIEEFLRLPISYLHVFPYSERSDTAATRLDNPVEVVERRRRAARWRALSERKRESYLRSLSGREVEVIIEQLDDSCAYGTSGEYAPAKFSLDAPGASAFRIGGRVSGRVLAYQPGEKRIVCQ